MRGPTAPPHASRVRSARSHEPATYARLQGGPEDGKKLSIGDLPLAAGNVPLRASRIVA